jgi:DeoR/GlpR family transcriptional regulator of sugar metabolism
MLAVERRQKILGLLEKKGIVQVSELTDMFDISEVTARVDLENLQKEGLLKRTHGGAINTKATNFELNFEVRAGKYREEKKRIGLAAAELVQEGDVIILDAGSTVLEVAKNLKDKQNLTVITDALNIAMELGGRPGIEIIVTGGSFRDLTISLIGPVTERTISEFNVDKTFLGVNGVSLTKGLSCISVVDMQIKKAMINAAKEVILVADFSKFGRTTMAVVGPITTPDRIVTDSNVSFQDIKFLREKGIEVITV